MKDLPSQGGQIAFDGYGTLIVAKDTVGAAMPLCLGASGSDVVLTACFYQSVARELPIGWESATVAPEFSHVLNRWEFNPCSTADGFLQHDPATGSMHVSRSNHSVSGPRCVMKSIAKTSHCLSGICEGSNKNIAEEVRLVNCTRLWNQLLSFGDGFSAPVGSLFITVPHYLVDRMNLDGLMHHKYLCLGITEPSARLKEQPTVPNGNSLNRKESSPAANLSWSESGSWATVNHKISLTPCTNESSALEWIFVRFSEHCGDNFRCPQLGATSTDRILHQS